MTEKKWSLYIDESGQFDDRNASVVVAGVLVQGLRSGRLELRERLERIAPGLPWPLHANRLGQPAWIAAAVARDPPALCRDGADFSQAKRDILAAFWHRIRKQQPERTALVERELERGIENSKAVDAAKHLAGLMSRNECNAALAMAGEIRADMARVFEAVEADALHVLVAGESERDQAVAGDRYLATLPAMTRRAAKIVAAQPGAAVIHLHILTREVTDPVLDRKHDLHVRHLNPATSAGMHGRVRTATVEIAPYRGDVDPLFVFADFVANRALHPCSDRQSLTATESAIEMRLCRRPRSGQPPRSHLAATGLAEVIERGGPSATVTPSARVWAVQQAEEWRGQP
jgi:hypothetical protein